MAVDTLDERHAHERRLIRAGYDAAAANRIAQDAFDEVAGLVW